LGGRRACNGLINVLEGSSGKGIGIYQLRAFNRSFTQMPVKAVSNERTNRNLKQEA
jgi:hypothetical protein